MTILWSTTVHCAPMHAQKSGFFFKSCYSMIWKKSTSSLSDYIARSFWIQRKRRTSAMELLFSLDFFPISDVEQGFFSFFASFLPYLMIFQKLKTLKIHQICQKIWQNIKKILVQLASKPFFGRFWQLENPISDNQLVITFPN